MNPSRGENRHSRWVWNHARVRCDVKRRWPFGGGKNRKQQVRGGDSKPLLEIQIHPSDIRRKVRYFFLDRRQIALICAGLLAFLLFMGFNTFVAPQVISDLLGRKEYESLVSERRRQGERLQDLIRRMEGVSGESEELHLRMSRIYLAYGLESGVSVGQGGFPFESREVPESMYSAVIRQGAAMEARIREQQRVLETFLDEVQSFEDAHGDQVEMTPSTAPLRGSEFVLTSPFGNRRSPFTKKADFHAGIDLAAPPGTPIYAPADGQVVFAGRYPLRQSVAWWRYGNLVALRHGSRFITLFGHCEETLVRQGQDVKQGMVIATVGNTGWSTSPHLHYEVRHRAEEGRHEPVDPRIYILDHRWRDEEQLLVRARRAPTLRDFEPLPRIIGR